MKQFFLIIGICLYSLCMVAQVESVIPNAPNPPRLVNDFTGNFITREQVNALENKLVAYDDSTSNQIAIVIVDALQGYSIDEYAIALGRKWGVRGQRGASNGVVILVNTGAKGDKRGVFIATGYGAEGAVTDLISTTIVQNNLIPNFKKGNNYIGLDEATDQIIAALAGRYTAPEGYHNRGRGDISFFQILLIAIIVLVVLAFISRKGGGGGGYVSRRGYTDGWGGRRGGGMPWIIPGGWSGGGGGSSGGGGFGGFGGGGGGFGGGGAGGSW